MDNLDIELDAEIAKKKTDKKFKSSNRIKRPLSKGKRNIHKRSNDHYIKK